MLSSVLVAAVLTFPVATLTAAAAAAAMVTVPTPVMPLTMAVVRNESAFYKMTRAGG